MKDKGRHATRSLRGRDAGKAPSAAFGKKPSTMTAISQTKVVTVYAPCCSASEKCSCARCYREIVGMSRLGGMHSRPTQTPGK